MRRVRLHLLELCALRPYGPGRMTEVPSPIVPTEWLARNLREVRALDATWYLAAGRNARADFAAAHIPGAQFFDIEDISDKSTRVPHMLPGAAAFEERVRRLGVNAGDAIVVYDTMGLFSAARAWWMFRAMGHDNVAVLDGGLPKWRAEGRPVESGTAEPAPGDFKAKLRPALVRSLAQIEANLSSHAEQMVDARGPARFTGQEGEPRPGMRAGHIPGARNVPYTSLLNRDGTFKSDDELRKIFAGAGVALDKPVIASCGSGITANVVLLALAKLGRKDNALYDGSWAEYGASGLPVEV